MKSYPCVCAGEEGRVAWQEALLSGIWRQTLFLLDVSSEVMNEYSGALRMSYLRGLCLS